MGTIPFIVESEAMPTIEMAQLDEAGWQADLKRILVRGYE